LLISAGNWLWTTRFLTNVLLAPVRRKPNQKQVKDKICLNMFVDENSLAIFSKNKNLFAAYELSQLIPLYDKNNIYMKLISQNLWAREFLPNAFKVKRIKSITHKIKDKDRNLVENLLMKFQIMLMVRKRTTETTTESLIIFHPKDMTNLVLTKFNQKTKSI